ncbi:MAG: radical SAM protein [Candidatus Heimdallarchaeota archaeon]
MLDRKLILELTLDCNANCVYCYNSNNKIEYNTEIEKFLIPEKYLKKWNITNVILTGGEPLLVLDKTLKIIDYYKNKVNIVELITNGLLLNENTINKLQEVGLNIVNISCDGIEEKTQFKLRKTSPKLIWEKICAVKKFSQNNIVLNLLYTLTNVNNSQNDIVKFVNKALQEKVDGIKFQPVIADLNDDIKNLVIPSDQLLALLLELKEKVKDYQIINSTDFFHIVKELLQQKEHNIKYQCPVTESNIFINAQGALLKCPILNPSIPSTTFESYENVEFKKFDCRLKTHCLCMF